MKTGLSKNTDADTNRFTPTLEGWCGFREAMHKAVDPHTGFLKAGFPAPTIGTHDYYYRQPGPTRIKAAHVNDENLTVILEDGRRIQAPLSWFPILRDALPEERETFEVMWHGTWIYFPRLGADVLVDQLLAYRQGADEDAFIAASASEEEEQLLADIGALMRKTTKLTGKNAEEVLAALKRREPLD